MVSPVRRARDKQSNPRPAIRDRRATPTVPLEPRGFGNRWPPKKSSCERSTRRNTEDFAGSRMREFFPLQLQSDLRSLFTPSHLPDSFRSPGSISAFTVSAMSFTIFRTRLQIRGHRNADGACGCAPTSSISPTRDMLAIRIAREVSASPRLSWQSRGARFVQNSARWLRPSVGQQDHSRSRVCSLRIVSASCFMPYPLATSQRKVQGSSRN